MKVVFENLVKTFQNLGVTFQCLTRTLVNTSSPTLKQFYKRYQNFIKVNFEKK